jgi:hypothetical protein
MSGLKHQHTIPGRESIHNRRFPGAGPRSWVHQHRAARLNQLAHTVQGFSYNGSKFCSPMIHDRSIDRA